MAIKVVTSENKSEHDRAEMVKRAGKGANIRPAVNVDDVRKQYLANQEDNRHAENAVLLAKHFGTKKEHEGAEMSLKYRNKMGEYSSDDPTGMMHHKHSHEMHSKYYGHIIEDDEPKKEYNNY